MRMIWKLRVDLGGHRCYSGILESDTLLEHMWQMYGIVLTLICSSISA